MSMISRDERPDDGGGALFVFLALGGFWVLVAVMGWLAL